MIWKGWEREEMGVKKEERVMERGREGAGVGP